ncbi:MAG TPA: MarR family transcriptional regulator [Alphaproteobacteria bacterium]|nr:MarR family transcriptional regulator [Alphaproteobacteria bacterium]
MTRKTDAQVPDKVRRLDRADYERLAEFRFLLRRFLTFSKNAAEQSGLTAQQHQALLAIKGFPGPRPITTGDLAERLDIRHHSAVGLVDRLVSNALVRRRKSESDRRQVQLELTEKAEALLLDLSAAHRDELERLAPLLRTLLSHFDRTSNDKPAHRAK